MAFRDRHRNSFESGKNRLRDFSSGSKSVARDLRSVVHNIVSNRFGISFNFCFSFRVGWLKNQDCESDRDLKFIIGYCC